jgi:hypothetical protein
MKVNDWLYKIFKVSFIKEKQLENIGNNFAEIAEQRDACLLLVIQLLADIDSGTVMDRPKLDMLRSMLFKEKLIVSTVIDHEGNFGSMTEANQLYEFYKQHSVYSVSSEHKKEGTGYV